MRLSSRVVGLGVLGLLLVGGALAGPATATPPPPEAPLPPGAPAGPVGNLPPGLPATFWLGVSSQPPDLAWMQGSGVAWNARYQYLAGGVNTGNGWATWNTPAGQFATYYMDASAGAGYIPVFTYYQLLQSAPGTGGGEDQVDYNNLNNAATMNAYYTDFKLLLDKAHTFGQPVIVHVEPDFWGYMHQRVNTTTNSAASIAASVASSGYVAVADYPNTVQGFAQALLHLRDVYAPNVIMAIHASVWGWNGPDIGISTDPNLNATTVGQNIGAFLRTAGIVGNPAGTSSWDLVFGDPSDRDAAYYQYVIGDGGAHWWDLTNATYPNFDRYRAYVAALNATTGRRVVLWQLPVGNTMMRSENNTPGHYQDNRVQGLLGNNGTNLPDWIAAGLIGLLWGAGQTEQTHPTDDRGDGITNPAAINGNTSTATVADDDGGYLRAQAAAYYSRGPLPLPLPPTLTPTRTATRTATRTPTRTATRTATRTPTRTATRTATRTPTRTSTPANTPTRTATRTATRTSTAARTATRTPTRTPTPLPCASVTWTAAVNVSISGNTITKSSALNAWNAGAISSKAIQSGNGSVQATVASLSDYVMFGLSQGNTGTAYGDIDFAIYTYPGDHLLRIYEAGTSRGAFGAYAVGDVLKVAVTSGMVRYYRNGTLLYTSAGAPAYPLLLDSAIYNPGGRVSTAFICGGNLALALVLDSE